MIGAIETQRAILADPKQPREARRDALKFLVHLVGDVHQPMHASNHDDLGGNEFQISLRTDIAPEKYARNKYVDGVMGTNLHSVWDYYVLAERRLDLQAVHRRARCPAVASADRRRHVEPAGSLGGGVLPADRVAPAVSAGAQDGQPLSRCDASAGRAARAPGGVPAEPLLNATLGSAPR